uniref:Uncharacterized protein n=1 Tax=Parascaris equorum TaxID=6256 RepID=A0A914RTL0_PAREQ
MGMNCSIASIIDKRLHELLHFQIIQTQTFTTSTKCSNHKIVTRLFIVEGFKEPKQFGRCEAIFRSISTAILCSNAITTIRSHFQPFRKYFI